MYKKHGRVKIMSYALRQISFCVLFGILVFSCNTKFDRVKWRESADVQQYPNRDNMLEDLTKNYKLKGMNRGELIELIGEPEENMKGDTNEICYPVFVEYGRDIDPVDTKTLVFQLKKDIVVDFKIEEH